MKFSLGYGTRNMLLNDSNRDAAYRQDPTEHTRVLHQFERPGQTPIERLLASQEGMVAEQELPEYWDDQIPRKDVGGSSSWIDEIEYLPSLGIAVVKSNGKQYFYPKSAKEVGDTITSDSIGSDYNRSWKRI